MRKNKQNVVLNQSSEAFGNCSEIFRSLILAMTTAGDGVILEVILCEKLLLVFRCFTNKMVIFGVVFRFVKNKVIILSFEGF